MPYITNYSHLVKIINTSTKRLEKKIKDYDLPIYIPQKEITQIVKGLSFHHKTHSNEPSIHTHSAL